MSYIEGFVVAVPEKNKDAYVKLAHEHAPMFKEFGVSRMVETWGDDVPDGKVTDFRRAVKAEPGEAIVFSWFEFPSKQIRDAANEKMSSDPRMQPNGDGAPFDGMRMIWAGFETLLDERLPGSKPGYVDGSLLPVRTDKKDLYRSMSREQAAVLREHGATRVIAGWGDNVPEGKVTDYQGAVKLRDGETVVYSWIEWPSKEVRDAGWEKVYADPRMHPPAEQVPQDESRRVHGGFTPIVDA
jgi:uncharacterized protein YbaA (DUF1428 family)